MNGKLLTSIILSSVVFTGISDASRMRRVYVPVLSDAESAAARASTRVSTILRQLHPILPTKNYGRVTKDIKEYWDGTHLIKEATEGLKIQEKAELCSDLALSLNSRVLGSQVAQLLHAGGFWNGANAFNLSEVSAECKSVLFNNFVYSLTNAGSYSAALQFASTLGYWNGSSISPGLFSGVDVDLKAELYANLAYSLAQNSGASEELKELMAKTLFWNRTAAPASGLSHVSPAPKAALGAALSCAFIKSSNYKQLIDLVMRPWGYFNGSTFVAPTIRGIPEPYKSTVKSILEIGFEETGRSSLIPALQTL